MESDNRAIESVAENFKKLGVIKAGPTHCSGPEAARIFKEKYGKKIRFDKNRSSAQSVIEEIKCGWR